MNRVIRFFRDTHLGNGHEGLAYIAKKEGIDVRNLPKGEFVIFANKRMNGIKAYTQNCVAYLKSPDGRRLEMKTIQKLPNYFSGSSFRYDDALAEVFSKMKMNRVA